MSGIIGNKRFTEGIPDTDAYWDLFQTTGWNGEYRFSREELARSLENSWYAVSVYGSGQLVGFGRVIADGVHHALIVDLIVRPDFRGRGIGREILGKLVKRCREENIRDIQLFAARGNSSFYEKCDFIKRDEEAPGMEYQ